MTVESELSKAKREHQVWLQQQVWFQGVGIGVDGSARACLKIFTNKMPAETRLLVEQRISNVNIEFEETGPIRKQ